MSPKIFSSLDFAEARARATAVGKILLVDFTAAWCGPCKAMDRTTWIDPEVIALIDREAVAIQVDVDREEALAKELRIRSMPTVVAFRGAHEIDRMLGRKSARELIEWVNGVLRGETMLEQLMRARATDPTDVHKRLDLANAFAAAGRLDEATDEYRWLWSNMLQHGPSMRGVRLSFMVESIRRLAEQHPPARVGFGAIRDALEAPIAAGTWAGPELRDWAALNAALGESGRTLAWYDLRTDGVPSERDRQRALVSSVRRLLIDAGRWADVARLHPDPLSELRERHGWTENARRATDLGDDAAQMIDAMEGVFRSEAGVLHACSLAAGNAEQARAIAEEARRLCPGEETDRALHDALEKAGLRAST